MLDAIITESNRYGMQLNRAKCEYIGLNMARAPLWPDGTAVKTVQQAKYLGSVLDHVNNNDHEVS